MQIVSSTSNWIWVHLGKIYKNLTTLSQYRSICTGISATDTVLKESSIGIRFIVVIFLRDNSIVFKT